MLKRIIKNSVYLLFAECLAKLLIFILTIFFARALGVDQFGAYSFIFAYAWVFSIFIDFGTSFAYVKNIAQDKRLKKEYLENIVSLKCFLGVCVLIAMVVVGFILKKNILAIILAGLFVFIDVLNESLKVIFRAYEQLKSEAVSKIVEKLFFFVLGISTIFLTIFGKITVTKIFLFYAIAALAGLFVTFYFLKRFGTAKFLIDVGKWKLFIRESLPYFLLIAFTLIFSRIDAILLGIMESEQAIGLYNAANQIVLALGIIPVVLVKAVLPRFASLHEQKAVLRKFFGRIFWAALLLGGVISLAIFISAPLIIQMLYGEEFAKSVPALQLLIWSFFIISFSTITSFFVIAMNRQAFVMKAAGVAALINIILNLILIPLYSFIGAAIANIATQLLLFIMYYVRARILLKGGGTSKLDIKEAASEVT